MPLIVTTPKLLLQIDPVITLSGVQATELVKVNNVSSGLLGHFKGKVIIIYPVVGIGFFGSITILALL